MTTLPNDLFDRFSSLFSSQRGESLYRRACDTVRTFGMAKKLQGGVLVGLSGGADSVFLLGFLLTLRARKEEFDGVSLSDFPIVSCHVHHGIRGAQADEDLAFSSAFSRALGVEFLSRKTDVPAIAREKKLGTEETARIERYSIFDEIISGRDDLSAIALAHNATDQVETFLFRLLRGAGTDGLCSIPFVRDGIVRPLLSISSEETRASLDAFCIPYAVDSTNFDIAYKRNLIRLQILPALRLLNPDPESAVARAVKNLSEDRVCLSGLAEEFLRTHEAPYLASELSALPSAVFYRVFAKMCAECGFSPEECHVDAVRSGLLQGSDFTASLPLGYVFSVRGEEAAIVFPEENAKKECEPIIFPKGFGQNNGVTAFEIKDFGALVLIAVGDECEPFPKNWQNVYRFAIQADLSSAMIEDGFALRFRREGDSYRYKGISHKLKKLMNDKKIPPHLRGSVPVFTDARGILWVPGFGTRDDGAGMPKRIAVYFKNTPPTPASLHIPYRGIFFAEDTSE